MFNLSIVFSIIIYGVLTANLIVIGLVIPYLILMGMVAVVIAYAKTTYPSIAYAKLLKMDMDETFNKGKMVIFVVICKLCYGFAISYTGYLLFEKFYGVMQ